MRSFGPLLAKAVQSPNAPYIAPVFPAKHSTSCPMVIRLGRACGLMIRSGRTPSAVKGISSSGITRPTVPFCPHRLHTLSPISGIRTCLTRTLAVRKPSPPRVINALSTTPFAPFLVPIDESIMTAGSSILVVASPMTTVFSLITSPSLMTPFSPSLL